VAQCGNRGGDVAQRTALAAILSYDALSDGQREEMALRSILTVNQSSRCHCNNGTRNQRLMAALYAVENERSNSVRLLAFMKHTFQLTSIISHCQSQFIFVSNLDIIAMQTSEVE
jgi:hypothetical protein